MVGSSARVLRSIKRNRDTRAILIIEDKADPSYYDISTSTRLRNTALALLYDWQKWCPVVMPDAPELPSMTKEEIEKLPEGPVRVAAKAEQSSHEAEQKNYDGMVQHYNNVGTALKERNGELAWDCLREDYASDYGRFSMRVEFVQEIEPPEGALL